MKISENKIIFSFLIILCVVPILVLVGWTTGNKVLTSVLPQFTPMNPVSAVSFILVALCFLLVFGKDSMFRKFCFLFSGAFLVIVGSLMLVKYITGLDVQIDRILFTAKLGINRMAPTTAVNFLLVGIYLLFYHKVLPIMRVFMMVVFCISTYAFLAYLYNFVGIYGETIYNPMAIHTALLFEIISLYVLTQRGFVLSEIFENVRGKKWFAFFVGGIIFSVSVVITGGVSFLLKQGLEEQSQLRFASQANQITTFIQTRMDLYTGIVYGIQGLFAASNSVEEEEWQTYIKKMNIPENYSGISGVSYANKISSDNVKNFPYTIYPFTEKSVYYPLTYYTTFVSSATTTPQGFDYSSDSVRAGVLDQSIRMNKPKATPVVYGVTNHIPLFSVYAPVYAPNMKIDTEKERLAAVIGIISVSFRLEKIFPDLAHNPLFDSNIDVKIVDHGNNSDTVLYETKNGFLKQTNASLNRFSVLNVGDRKWEVFFATNPNINLSPIERNAHIVLFMGGVLFSLLLSIGAALYIISGEKALAARTILLSTLAVNFPYGMFIEDENRKIVLANKKMGEMFGINANPKDFFGKDIRKVAESVKHVFKDFGEYMKKAEEIISLGKTVSGEKIELANEMVISRSYIPLFLDNKSHGGMWIYQDITEEQKVDQMKTEFVSLASHQLRTPLTSIKWYTELLSENKKMDTEQAGYVTEVGSATDRMIDLVNSLLNVSRLELGKFAIDPKENDILEVVNIAVKEQQPTFKEKNQTFVYNHPDSIPSIMIDQKITHIVVQNLLSNAHKYTQDGGMITFSLEVSGTKENGGYVLMTCTDNGYGIPKSQQTNIFKKLFRADNIRSLDVEGTGLGLYIIKTVIEAAGCDISFESEEKKGTSFIVKIPLSGMKERTGGKTLSEKME